MRIDMDSQSEETTLGDLPHGAVFRFPEGSDSDLHILTTATSVEMESLDDMDYAFVSLRNGCIDTTHADKRVVSMPVKIVRDV